MIAVIATLVVMTPLLWGWEVRHHRGARQAAEHLAGLEHELATTRAAHAVETERRSIAHDLHDVIAGHLSAVSLHTSLASSLEDPAARDRSLHTARDCAHAALRDLRSMIGVLSSEQAGALPEVTLDWSSLAARLRDRDPAAQVRIDPAVTDPARVEPSVQAALLRIGAEAVTNAVRHGRAPISLDVEVAGGEARLELRNRRTDSSEAGGGVGRGAGRAPGRRRGRHRELRPDGGAGTDHLAAACAAARAHHRLRHPRSARTLHPGVLTMSAPSTAESHAPQDPIRVVVADDHPAVRSGLVALLSSAGDITVVAEAADGRTAVAAAAQHRPDVVLTGRAHAGRDRHRDHAAAAGDRRARAGDLRLRPR